MGKPKAKTLNACPKCGVKATQYVQYLSFHRHMNNCTGKQPGNHLFGKRIKWKNISECPICGRKRATHKNLRAFKQHFYECRRKEASVPAPMPSFKVSVADEKPMV